ncbi:MogA/MoaB family molybdenum cofactor biosynthesis protein [Enterococcus caccae]|uniref:Molybdenum cofactor synthesis domain-containing protein n=1 Tax=Enterococcus caccae ATCC BAA-1240 TaxID=1158612 RepID=R3TXQ7_9ENTE|nr:MogA/MoaB family molybdenum cofactor biosynthesis protein [Enterococcus caccae]EOL46389.1 molybdenum cofactor synthesis domain-containing protein [Enterococcus caccae ATCC BAA-1240]EOT60758.1 molybdenum cofactor biosynthesis family protein [Enterococcus caccae ATCC BAA-1240]
MYKVGIVTLSDSGYQGLREDESGQIIKQLIQDQFQVVKQTILPDEMAQLSSLLIEWCSVCDLILTTGGTGLGIRDITPETTLKISEKEIPGISEGMRMQSIQKTPFAMLSRGVAVQRGQTLIINLPGSPKGVTENLTYLRPILPHALDILTNRKTEH